MSSFALVKCLKKHRKTALFEAVEKLKSGYILILHFFNLLTPQSE